MQEDDLDMSVLQFEFDASAITTNHRRIPHHRRRLLQTLPSSSIKAPTIQPPLASISAHDTRVKTPPSQLASISAKIPDSSNTPATTAAGAPAGTILPVGIKRGPHPRRYLWDGHRLVAVELSDLESVSSAASALETKLNNTDQGTNKNRKNYNGRKNSKGVFVPLPSLEHAVARWLHSTRASFFPHPDEVTPDYWEWCKWRAAHRIFSSMASVFGTQSLLLAVGVGAKRTLPAAAAINWVLKDGLGRLGRLSVATRFGESFDSDLKRFRFSSSLLYATSLSLDFLTPLFPQYFLPMASIANVGKSVGLTTYISTQPAFHRSFAVSENLADISAKSQAQQMAVDTLGLAVAVTLSALCARHSESARRLLPLLAFPVLAGGDLMAISNELRSIHLRTLNKERAEIIAAEFVSTGQVATPENVSAKERLILPPACSLGVLPLSFGGLEEVLTTGEEVENFLGIKKTKGSLPALSSSVEDRKRYALKVVLPCHSLTNTGSINQNQKENSSSGGTAGTAAGTAGGISNFLQVVSDMKKWAGIGKNERGAVHAALRTDASPEDVLEIILRTAKLRRNLLLKERKNNNKMNNEMSGSGSGGGNGGSSGKSCSEAISRNIHNSMDVDVSADELHQFTTDLREAGWQVAPFMLSSAEKKFYCQMN